MGLIRPRVLVRGFDRPNLKYLTLRLKEREKKNETVDIIRKLSAPTIVYCATKRITSRLAEQLRDEGIPCAAYHAGLDKHARTRIQNRFFEGSLPVIVATNAFGMGIDKPDIRLLIHYNMPGSVEAFYQESGRAGRDGKPAYSLLFGNRHDTAIQHYLIAQSFPTEEIVRAVYRFLLDFPANPVLLTYREIARELPRRAGEIVIGNALKVLESHRLIRRLSEKQHPATVGFAVPIERIIQRHRRYPGRKRILDEFLRRFPDAGAGATRCFSLPALCRAAGQSREQVNRNLRALARSKDLVYVPPFSGRGIEKIEPLPNDPAPAVDFDRLEANRRRQLAKVARMEEYLGAASCKRHFLLRYFGESPEKARCGACDVCLGWRASNRRTPSNFPSDKRNAPVAPRRRALAKTAETLSGEEERLFYCGVLKYNRKLGLLPFLRLLCGSRERAILSRGLDRCSFYAALGDSSLGRLNRFFLHEKKSGNLTRTRSRRFPKIALTDKGMEKARLLLKGLSGGSPAGGGLEAESACQSR
jgi:ATP-dependent DNA helicase RecQ